ncbi:MAG: o-succinylbenzoate synthase [Bacteroidetes bacterium]|nr:o-succinylbenzoate synthase [Bacteroidota bacterium]
MKIDLYRYRLRFIKPAVTSRNVFEHRDVFYAIFSQGDAMGVGEMAPLSLLSTDDVSDYQQRIISRLEMYLKQPEDVLRMDDLPSFTFGLETAMMDLQSAKVPGNFEVGSAIAINGLVWMNTTAEMLDEAFQKIESGFRCIKFKVGAQDFDAECRMLEAVRKRYSAFKVELRLDANGAFDNQNAAEQLSELKRFDIHSIEQPIAKGDWWTMADLVSRKLIDIALDEELIGLNPSQQGEKLLNEVHPAYLILKPNLLGGFKKSDQWIQLANQHSVNWWATSALESNVGLNGIARWVSKYPLTLPQGLGTGSLFQNNISSPLTIDPPFLRSTNRGWDYQRIREEGEPIGRWEG